MTILQHSIAQAAAAAGGYQIARSLRFNSADSAYLTRTPASAGNRRTWTWNANIKRSALDTEQFLFDCSLSLNETSISFSTGNALVIYAAVAGSVVVNLITTQVFRDVGAHMNIQLTVDTTQATAANRLKLYINGVQVTAFSTATYCAQNTDLIINTANTHSIGRNTNGANRYASMYFSDMRLIDGQALDPTSFGEFDANTGVWNPKTYSGTYGTNGFYLPFSDNAGADSFGIGTDLSASALNRVELGNTSVGYSVLGTMTYGVGAAAVNLRDNNASTAAADPNGINVNTAMGYDFGRAIKIRKITTLTASTSGVSYNLVFNIQYSDDNSTWATITGTTTTHNISSGTGQSNSTSFDDNGSHRYWRLFYSSGTIGGDCWIATLDMFVNSIGPNSWFPVNFSVTAGVGNDSLVDTPTNYGTDTGAGGEVRGNYCTWNAISNTASGLANGNLDLTASSPMTRANSTIAVSSGKWYYEIRLNTAGTNSSAGIGQNFVTNSYPGYDALSYSFEIDNARIANNDVLTSYGSACTAGDTFMCAIDLDNNKIFFGKNGTWFNSSNPVTGASPAFSITAGTYCAIARPYGGSAAISANFGQRPFAYTAPSGFKALCTQNLPTPAIGATSSTLANKNFDVNIWTGTGTTAQNITNSGAFQPDLVWIKGRSGAYWHELFDPIRGVNKPLFSNVTNVEANYTSMTAFLSNGFTVQDNGTTNQGTNAPGATFVGWQWKGGNGTVSNTSGSITSTVSANSTAGISVITYTAPSGSGDFTFGHGLGVVPKLFITRFTTQVSNWCVYHESVGASAFLKLNTTDASTSSSGCFGTGPTSSLITIKQSAILGAAGACVAYAFAEVAGFSKIGSYTGNGSADGPFVYCGFRPRWILCKNTDAGTEAWTIIDAARNTHNVANARLFPNLANAESTGDNVADILSNGFKLRSTDAATNASRAYIFIAFAEAPFNYSRAR